MLKADNLKRGVRPTASSLSVSGACVSICQETNSIFKETICVALNPQTRDTQLWMLQKGLEVKRETQLQQKTFLRAKSQSNGAVKATLITAAEKKRAVSEKLRFFFLWNLRSFWCHFQGQFVWYTWTWKSFKKHLARSTVCMATFNNTCSTAASQVPAGAARHSVDFLWLLQLPPTVHREAYHVNLAACLWDVCMCVAVCLR